MTPQASILLSSYIHRLSCAGVFNPEADVHKIINYACGPHEPFRRKNIWALTHEQRDRIEHLIARRERREPLARIFGIVDFMDVKIHVASNVFRPCSEAEALIDQVVSHSHITRPPKRILDLGTGSGCLLLSLLKEFPLATGHGTDINPKAIAAAKRNAEINELSSRAQFSTGNWADHLNDRYDLIISHPPVVPTKNIPHMCPEMKNFDPFESLDGGKDGLDFFRYMSRNFHRLATTDGFGVFTVYSLSAEKSFFSKRLFQTEVKRNYAGMPCCMFVSSRPEKSAISIVSRLIKRA